MATKKKIPQNGDMDSWARRSERLPVQTEVEFITDFDIVQAESIDLSDNGICFETRGPLPFEMCLEWEGEKRRYRAHLVWMKQLPEGGARLGLQFIPIKKDASF